MLSNEQIDILAQALYDVYWSPQYLSKPFWALWENVGLVEKEGFRELAKFASQHLTASEAQLYRKQKDDEFIQSVT